MTITVQIDGKSVNWTHAQVEQKLRSISNLRSKNIAWIKKDLDVSPSWWITRLIWTAVGKRFECLRKNLYGVDLDQSRNILKQIAGQIKSSANLRSVYFTAFFSFNLIASRHALTGEDLGDDNPVITTTSTPSAGASASTNPPPAATVSAASGITVKGENRAKKFINSLNWSADKKIYVGHQHDENKYKALEAELNALLDEHNAAFKCTHNPATDHGVVGKRDLPPNSQIFVRADLHGDLKSLVENLRTHQQQGMLDENFRCKPGTQLVFLGDYTDRGEYSLQVLKLIMLLRLENPENVTLIRGNHETLWVNTMFGGNDQNWLKFVADAANTHRLEQFYNTLYLTMYMSEAAPEGTQRQYLQFTHGLFEPTIDPSTLLSSPQANALMVVPKSSQLPERIKKLVVYSEAEIAIKKLIGETKDFSAKWELERTLNDLDKAEVASLRLQLGNAVRGSAEYKLLKQRIAARVLVKLVSEQNRRTSESTAYNWGDMASGDWSSLGELVQRRWYLCVADVKHILRLMSTDHKIKIVVRGHQHAKEHFTINDKVVVSTMPVGMNCMAYATRAEYRDQFDTAYIFTTAQSINGWQKRAYFRKTHEETKEVTPNVNLRDPKV